MVLPLAPVLTPILVMTSKQTEFLRSLIASELEAAIERGKTGVWPPWRGIELGLKYDRRTVWPLERAGLVFLEVRNETQVYALLTPTA